MKRNCAKLAVAALATISTLRGAFAYQGWTGKAGDNLLDNPQNWGTDPKYQDLTSSSASGDGWDANLKGLPTGWYALDGDLVINRFIFDAPDLHPVIDLSGKTLTAVGRALSPALAFRGTALSSGDSLVLTNGTFFVPDSPYEEQVLGQNYVAFGHNQEGRPNDITLTVTGVGAKLRAPRVDLVGGTNYTLSVENGATLETALNMAGLSSEASVGHVFRLDNGTYRHLGAFASGGFPIGRAGSVNNRLELLGGWQFENMNPHVFPVGAASGASGSRLVVGAGATVTITNRPSIPASAACADCGITVKDGGRLVFDNETDVNRRRFWLGANGCAADILVSGTGSVLESKGSVALIGQGASGCSLRVTAGGQAQFASATIGADSSASGSRLVVADGGSASFTGTLSLGGQGDEADTGKRSVSNVLEVVSGGTVSLPNAYLNVGNKPYAYGNGLLVSGEGSAFSGRGLSLSGAGWMAEKGLVGGHWVRVADGGKILLTEALWTRGQDLRIEIDGGQIVCGTVFSVTNAATVIVGCTSGQVPSGSLIKAEKVYFGAHNVPGSGAEKDVIRLEMTPESSLADGEVLTVVEATEVLRIDEEVLSAFRATLPDGCSARLRKNVLTVKRRPGLVMVLR